MKKLILLSLVMMALMPAMAQQKITGKTTLTLTNGGVAKTFPIDYATYSFNKINLDSIEHQPINSYVSVVLNKIEPFILKAASTKNHSLVDVKIINYDSTGKLIHTLILKKANISALTDTYGLGNEQGNGNTTIGFETGIMIVDGVKM